MHTLWNFILGFVVGSYVSGIPTIYSIFFSVPIEGKDLINEIIKKSNERLKIVVAGKVTKENLNELSNLIYANEFHGKLIV